MSRIFLIRHAQSANNALPESQRVCDPGLTALGYHQAAATASALITRNVRQIFCSPFLRSLETARVIAQATGCQPEVRSDLFEQGGCYSGYITGAEVGQPGLGAVELASRYPGWRIDGRIASSGWWGRDYETLEQAGQRARSVRAWLEEQVVTQNGTLDILVIHADFKRLLILELLGKNNGHFRPELFGPLLNAGITELEFSRDAWTLHAYNSTSHLNSGQLT
jgi:2,3-bisphosphoglycerate-dependent phosphoglycerate mutase